VNVVFLGGAAFDSPPPLGTTERTRYTKVTALEETQRPELRAHGSRRRAAPRVGHERRTHCLIGHEESSRVLISRLTPLTSRPSP
jgi:hypothetical protein